MELILGQSSQIVHCTKFTSLTEEICKIPSHLRVVVISCLSGILNSLLSASDTKVALEWAMMMLGSDLFDVVRHHRHGSIRFIHCTTDSTPVTWFQKSCQVCNVSERFFWGKLLAIVLALLGGLHQGCSHNCYSKLGDRVWCSSGLKFIKRIL